MRELAKTPATLVWTVLIAATAISWGLGSNHGFSHDSETAAGVAVLLIAFIKVRLVGLYFMELRNAPLALRAIFEAYCLIVAGVVVGMFIFA